MLRRFAGHVLAFFGPSQTYFGRLCLRLSLTAALLTTGRVFEHPMGVGLY
jgi:hypothetical protein